MACSHFSKSFPNSPHQSSSLLFSLFFSTLPRLRGENYTNCSGWNFRPRIGALGVRSQLSSTEA